ncbi:TetR/AcrR family transcriptional regulator [Ponticaulis sp.]|uniref:TetR/AcrR family transcriptional regulator n=1 Tax=Ponticaulis sp. TaxID=2020902 RepID=UPI0025E3458A|nr:TetR/AcrR family transcriptional regulator [Ponticaulis sp.]
MTTLAREFGLSPNGLAKICDRVDVERPPKGYWNNGGGADIAPLLSALSEPDEIISIGGKTSASRKSRTRMPLERRKLQVLGEARQIARTQGVHEVSLRTIARNLGISEAQAHNCFSTREDILFELGCEELDAYESVRVRSISRGSTRITKVIMSSVSHLREAAQRGPLLQNISADSALRKRLNRRQRETRGSAVEQHVTAIMDDTNASQQVAYLKTKMLSGLVKRAGHLVAAERLSLTEAERLCVPIIVDSAVQQKAP